jgi:hypothetical protein
MEMMMIITNDQRAVAVPQYEVWMGKIANRTGQ